MKCPQSYMLVSMALVAIGVLASCERGESVETDDQTTALQLCVVRHAEAFKNLDPRPADLTPEQLDTLTPQGEAQARELHSALADGVAFVWTSPTNRTQQTASLLGLEVEVQVVDDLRSLDGGVPWSERMREWSAGHDPRPEGGESLADGQARVVALLAQIRGSLAPGQSAVIVTHADIASLVLGELRGTPLLERPVRDTLDTGRATCLPLSSVAFEVSP